MSSKESQVTTLDDEATPAPAVVATKSKAKAVAAPESSDEGMFMVTVHATDGDAGSNAVDMCINGYLYQLPRGVPCKVPAAVLEGLKNAVTSKYKVMGTDVVESTVPRFPYSAVPA